MKRIGTIIVSTIVVLVILGCVAWWFNEGQVSEGGIACSFKPKIDKKSAQNITEIVTTLGDTSTLGLALKKSHLQNLGDEVDQKVPSFEFLAYIFSHPELANQMAKVRTSSFKYNSFVAGLSPNMMKESKGPCFEKKVKEFANYLKVDPNKTWEIVQEAVKKGNDGDSNSFKPLVDYLIDQKATEKNPESTEKDQGSGEQKPAPSKESKTEPKPGKKQKSRAFKQW